MRLQVFNEYIDKTVLDLFTELGIQITNQKADFGFVYQKDINVLRVSREYNNFYSFDLARKLIKKDLLSEYFSELGFDVLPARVINSENDFDSSKPFIIKPILSQGGKRLASSLDDSAFSYRIFHKEFPRQVLLYPGKYFWQEAVTDEIFYSYTISGSINGDSDVWFFRDSKNEKINITGYNSRTRKYNYPEVSHLHDKLQTFIRDHSIRNAAFAAQFLKYQGKFYIHDWNFRISKRFLFDMKRGNQIEMVKYFKHMFDIPCDLPDTYPGEWVIDCEAEKHNFDLKKYYQSSMVINE